MTANPVLGTCDYVRYELHVHVPTECVNWKPQAEPLRDSQPECEDCRRCAAHAYSDATTPGFFHDKCEKHRRPKPSGVEDDGPLSVCAECGMPKCDCGVEGEGPENNFVEQEQPVSVWCGSNVATSLPEAVVREQEGRVMSESKEHVVRDATKVEAQIDCCGDRYPCNVALICSCGMKLCRGDMLRHLLELHKEPK